MKRVHRFAILQGIKHLSKKQSYHTSQLSQVTPFRITKPFSHEFTYEDIHLAQPSRENLAIYIKDCSLTANFLKKYKRDAVYEQLLRLSQKGEGTALQVEKSVYLTKKELLHHMWENGFEPSELELYSNSFPDDYVIHYLELALLFDCPASECFKYCIRVRSETEDNNFVELKKSEPTSKVGFYGLLSTGLWFASQNNILSNVWAITKTWPFFAVLFMLASRFQDALLELFNNAPKESTIALDNRLRGEEAVYNQIQVLQDKRRCLTDAQEFPQLTQECMQRFQKALLSHFKKEMGDNMIKHLESLRQNQNALTETLKKIYVEKTVEVFYNEFRQSVTVQQSIIDQIIDCIAQGDYNPLETFVKSRFHDILEQIHSNPHYKPILDDINRQFQEEYHRLLDKFTVRRDEAILLRKLAKKTVTEPMCSSLDINRLDEDDMRTLNALHKDVMKRVGLECLLGRTWEIEDVCNGNQSCADLLNVARQTVHRLEADRQNKEQQRFLRNFL